MVKRLMWLFHQRPLMSQFQFLLERRAVVQTAVYPVVKVKMIQVVVQGEHLKVPLLNHLLRHRNLQVV